MLAFHPYLPAAALLGAEPDTLGFAPQGILGASLADLRARFAGTLVQDPGAAPPELRLELPPTEWEDHATRVELEWGDDGRVESVWFDLPYRAYAPAKDELLALIEAKWGEPTDGTYLGEKAMMFRSEAPFIVVTDDRIRRGWDVRVLSKPPE
jgi:hypothetical protein